MNPYLNSFLHVCWMLTLNVLILGTLLAAHSHRTLSARIGALERGRAAITAKSLIVQDCPACKLRAEADFVGDCK